MKKTFTLFALLLAAATASAQWAGFRVASISTEPATTLTDGYYALFQNGHKGFAFLAETPLAIPGGATYNLAKSRISASAPGIATFADLEADIATNPAPNDRLWYVFKIVTNGDGTCTIQCPDGTYFPEFETRAKLVSSETPGALTYHEHGTYFSFESNGQALDGDTYEAGYANVSTLATWDYSTPTADGNAAWTLYPVELEEAGPVSVTFSVVSEAGEPLDELTLPYAVGTEVTEVPEALQRDFVTLTLQQPLTVSEDEAANTVTVTATWDLPFEPSTVEEPVYYFLSTEGGFYGVNLTRYSIPVGGKLNLETYLTDPYTLDEIRALPEEEQANYHFAFIGNPYQGFVVYSEVAARYLIQRNDNTWVGSEDDAAVYELVAAEGGFYFRHDGKLLGYRSGALGLTAEADATAENNALTATPFDAVEEETVVVVYTVVDAEGEELASLEEEVEAGTEISDLPAELKRPYTEYTLPDEPLVASADGENTYTAVATFDLPFPVVEGDETNAFFILTENAEGVLDHALSQYAIAGAGTYIYNENALSINAAEGADLTDMNNWYTYRNESMVLANPGTASQYGLNWSLYDDFYWTLQGNPYAGFELRCTDSMLPFVTSTQPYCELESATVAASLLEVLEADAPEAEPVENVRAKAPEGLRGYYLKSEDGYVKLHEYGVLEVTQEPSEALKMYFVPVNWEVRSELYDAYVADQAYINELVGVSAPAVAAPQGRTYDLQGRRLAAPQRGLNIVNGRKVLVK